MVGGKLNLSSSEKIALALETFLSKEGAFHWPQKTTILCVLTLRVYKSKRHNVQLYASAKGIPNTVSWGAKVLKSSCAPLATKFTYKKGSGENWDVGCGLAQNTLTVMYK